MNNLQLIFNLIIISFLGLLIILWFKDKWQKESFHETEKNQGKEKIDLIQQSVGNLITQFNSFSNTVTKDTTKTSSEVDSGLKALNTNLQNFYQNLQRGQQSLDRVFSGVKKYGNLGEYTLGTLIKDMLPPSQYKTNVKMKPHETGENVEFTIKLQGGAELPIDSHWPLEKFNEVKAADQAGDNKALASARKKLATDFRKKAQDVYDKYILGSERAPNAGVIYVPVNSLYDVLTDYEDPETKESLDRELITKYNVTIQGPKSFAGYLQAIHFGFYSLKVQTHAKQIYNDLNNITSRFEKHFKGIESVQKKLSEAINVTLNFGRDARSITNTLKNIRDPEQIEKATKEENVEKVDFKDKTNVS